MSAKRRITVIGGGIGGYTAAIRAARLGGQITLVEQAEIGGTCLNWGCIPFKLLLQSASVASTVNKAKEFGIKTGPPEVDYAALISRKNQVVAELRKGVQSLVKAKRIRLVVGSAELFDGNRVEVTSKKNATASVEEIQSDRVIIATGSKSSSIPIPGLDKVKAQNSDDFLNSRTMPSSTIIIGGGVIGVELAQILNGLGGSVTILELQNQVIPGFDKEIADILESELKQQGVTIIKGVLISGAAMSKNKLKKIVTFKIDGKEQTISADEIVVAVGREPVMPGVSPQKLGLDLNNVPMKGIKVNCHMETNLSNVYAVGDVTGEIMLAHVASAQAEVAAYNALRDEAARPKVMDYKSIPSCVYTSPEVAFVGLTEEQAMKKVDVEVGRFPFSASGKARLLGEIGGMVKIIADKKYGEVLGVHIIGSRATDMIAEAVLGMNMEITIDELANTVHPHPTLSEGVMEAALSLSGGAIHIP